MIVWNKEKKPVKKIHVLIADDDIDILRLLRSSLLREGYKVTTAKDGMDALERINIDRPDVIILDIVMPLIDGLNLLEKLKSQRETERIPVILLTQKRSYHDIKVGYNFGADFYITKPFKVSQIIEGIKIVTKMGGITE